MGSVCVFLHGFMCTLSGGNSHAGRLIELQSVFWQHKPKDMRFHRSKPTFLLSLSENKAQPSVPHILLHFSKSGRWVSAQCWCSAAFPSRMVFLKKKEKEKNEILIMFSALFILTEYHVVMNRTLGSMLSEEHSQPQGGAMWSKVKHSSC